ncbi:Oidioi.mRNA.OKI2018_I69.chr1.g3153.t1.cds [Oikopleura dioica]|uniref:Oidioi.mRNA.OKI2018_I69.chr1.g3153.t1.cds n=1 Tax=Oikopleura dioica TaxID=34765 RepID=A0ABN7ST58_OIKDI|nr:Oidioi.mRNA.OKI2018_I69.chr1.g3153.t1.cds [Oikopleura dioica]
MTEKVIETRFKDPPAKERATSQTPRVRAYTIHDIRLQTGPVDNRIPINQKCHEQIPEGSCTEGQFRKRSVSFYGGARPAIRRGQTSEKPTPRMIQKASNFTVRENAEYS